MTRKEKLEKLRDDVALGGYPSKSDWLDVFPDSPEDDDYPRRMMASEAAAGWVDGAIHLHNAVLPNEGWSVEWIAKYPSLSFKPAAFRVIIGWGVSHSAYADTPARAFLLAILKVLISQEKAE